VVCCRLYVKGNAFLAQYGVAISLSFVEVVKDDQETRVKCDLWDGFEKVKIFARRKFAGRLLKCVVEVQ
jgi:hypothetical protein